MHCICQLTSAASLCHADWRVGDSPHTEVGHHETGAPSFQGESIWKGERTILLHIPSSPHTYVRTLLVVNSVYSAIVNVHLSFEKNEKLKIWSEVDYNQFLAQFYIKHK